MNIKDWVGENNQLGVDIWEKKYQHEGESFKEWLGRVSNNDTDLANLILNKRFLFGGRILANRGLDKLGKKVTYSNCYVLEPPKDNIESIYDTCSKIARTFSYGGGVGIDVSQLRPKGSKVNNTAKKTTGAVSFMDTFSQVAETIGQNGRRGALMISMDVNHPDIEDFIDIKTDLTKVTKANISVRVDDKFMEKVVNGGIHTMKFTTELGEEIVKEVDAKKLFMKLCENNWDYAEPGILYWDTIANYNLLSEDKDFSYAGVNPCAEEPLPAGGSCLLGAINLSEYITDELYFDFVQLTNDIPIIVKAMNAVLDEGLSLHPLGIQQETVRDYRQIGIGIMGLADLLIKLGIEYDSQEALDLCSRIAFTLANHTIKASALLAAENGSYPAYNYDAISKSMFYLNNTDEYTRELVKKHGLRNSQLLTIAPTGSISTMLGISGGIEPIFDTTYTRKTESLHGEDKYYQVATPIVEAYLKQDANATLDNLPSFFKTSRNIDPYKRVEMQGVWQESIDASISSTVNLVESYTVQDVYNLYVYAWEKGLKGMTIYREGCKRSGVLVSKPKEEENPKNELQRGEKSDIADDTVYYKRPVHIGCGKLNLFIGYSESLGAIQDLYIKKSGSGGCEKNLETTVIGMSLILRLGGTLEMIEKSFSGISTCSSFTSARLRGKEVCKGSYCGSAILNVINDFLQSKGTIKASIDIPKKESKVTEPVVTKNVKCPDCGAELASTGGCYSCSSCGYSKCD